VRLLADLYPGASLGRISRLGGGLSNGVFRVSYSNSGAGSGRFIVRLTTDHRVGSAANARKEYQTIATLHEARVPAPALLLLDETGERLGRPGIVMEDAGRPSLTPRNLESWLEQLASAILRLHAMAPEQFSLAHLPAEGPDDVQREVNKDLPEGLQDDPLAQSMRSALRLSVGRLTWAGPRLVHGDYWPGNTVWRRGRLWAIVDWTSAKVGDPRDDIAQCRFDLAMIQGSEAAARFLDIYQSHAPVPLQDVWFFDLLRGIDALSSFRSWLPGYHDIGLREITEAMMETRLRAFLTASLAEATV